MFAARRFFGQVAEEADLATVFLLAASGATTIFDASPNGLTVSRFGSATATTAETNFSGKYSISFDGVDSYLRLPNDPVLDLGTGDFTIELWVRPAGVVGLQHFAVAAGDLTSNWLMFRSNGATLQTFIGGSYLGGATGVVEAGVWQHLATCRSGSSVRQFKNGIQVGSTFTSTADAALGENEPVIGQLGLSSQFFTGYIQDLRISNTARYTSNFTPPGSLT